MEQEHFRLEKTQAQLDTKRIPAIVENLSVQIEGALDYKVKVRVVHCP